MRAFVGVLITVVFFSLASSGLATPRRPFDPKTVLEKALRSEVPGIASLTIEKFYTDRPIPEGSTLVSLPASPRLGVITFQFLAPRKNSEASVLINGNAVVRATAAVAVVKQPIAPNEALTEANVTFENHELTPFLQRGYYPSLASLNGLISSSYLRPGTVLSSGNTRVAPLVKPGGWVTLTHNVGALQVSLRAKALEAGHLNDWIRVENPDSHKLLRARVVREGEVSTR